MRAGSVIRDFVAAADTITLDETDRHRRRMQMVSDNGIAFLLDLAEATLLRHGDGLALEDGRVIEVLAATEDLYDVFAKDARHLATLAWQLGNRHLPSQILDDRIRIRRDHVIAEMLEALGAQVVEVEAHFDPEGGAYADHSHRSSADEAHVHGSS